MPGFTDVHMPTDMVSLDWPSEVEFGYMILGFISSSYERNQIRGPRSLNQAVENQSNFLIGFDHKFLSRMMPESCVLIKGDAALHIPLV